jgi:hypothetical protein
MFMHVSTYVPRPRDNGHATVDSLRYCVISRMRGALRLSAPWETRCTLKTSHACTACMTHKQNKCMQRTSKTKHICLFEIYQYVEVGPARRSSRASPKSEANTRAGAVFAFGHFLLLHLQMRNTQNSISLIALKSGPNANAKAKCGPVRSGPKRRFS